MILFYLLKFYMNYLVFLKKFNLFLKRKMCFFGNLYIKRVSFKGRIFRSVCSSDGIVGIYRRF